MLKSPTLICCKNLVLISVLLTATQGFAAAFSGPASGLAKSLNAFDASTGSLDTVSRKSGSPNTESVDTDNDTITDDIDNCPAIANPNQADQDNDAVGDACDNCLAVSNADQCDTNGDLYGNVCDADLDNNGIVNSFDLSQMRTSFGATGQVDADLDCNGIVNSFDLAITRQQFGGAPGPSGYISGASSGPQDSDADGVSNEDDFFPFDSSEWDDADLDGIGDNTDTVSDVSLMPVGNRNTGGQARGIYKEGKYVYVADGTNGLQVYELSSAGTFSNIGSFRLPLESGVDVNARSVEKVGNYLYLAYRARGLYVLDVSDPANPVQVFAYDTADRATFITISGDRLYLSDRTALLFFDISNPASPSLLGQYYPPNEIERIQVFGNLIYAAVYYSGVLILDVTDISHPEVKSFTYSGYAIWTVAKHGNYLFAGGEGSGLIVYDATDVTNLVEVASLALPDTLEEPTVQDQPPLLMQIHGSQLFVADGQAGLQVVDISDPLAPFVSASYETPVLQSVPDHFKVVWGFWIEKYATILVDMFNGIHLLNFGQNLDNDNDNAPNFLDKYPNDAGLQ